MAASQAETRPSPSVTASATASQSRPARRSHRMPTPRPGAPRTASRTWVDRLMSAPWASVSLPLRPDHLEQPEPDDLGELPSYDVALGVVVVTEPSLERSEHLLGRPAGRPDQEDVSEALLVAAVARG